MKSERGMALIPLILTIFIVLALAGAAIFMIGDGILYNKDMRRPSQEQNNTSNNNSTENNNVEENNNVVKSGNSSISSNRSVE